MSIELHANGRIAYPKEMEAEVQKVCELANQGKMDEVFRLLRDLQKQGKVDIILEDWGDL